MNTTLLFTVGFMSFSYLAVAYVITPANARFLLAGYNTLNEERRQAFDIDRYLTNFFKPFFKKLALFPPLSWLAVSALFDGEFTIIAWSIVQSLPFMWFLWRSHVFTRPRLS